MNTDVDGRAQLICLFLSSFSFPGSLSWVDEEEEVGKATKSGILGAIKIKIAGIGMFSSSSYSSPDLIIVNNDNNNQKGDQTIKLPNKCRVGGGPWPVSWPLGKKTKPINPSKLPIMPF